MSLDGVRRSGRVPFRRLAPDETIECTLDAKTGEHVRRIVGLDGKAAMDSPHVRSDRKSNGIELLGPKRHKPSKNQSAKEKDDGVGQNCSDASGENRNTEKQEEISTKRTSDNEMEVNPRRKRRLALSGHGLRVSTVCNNVDQAPDKAPKSALVTPVQNRPKRGRKVQKPLPKETVVKATEKNSSASRVPSNQSVLSNTKGPIHATEDVCSKKHVANEQNGMDVRPIPGKKVVDELGNNFRNIQIQPQTMNTVVRPLQREEAPAGKKSRGTVVNLVKAKPPVQKSVSKSRPLLSKDHSRTESDSHHKKVENDETDNIDAGSNIRNWLAGIGEAEPPLSQTGYFSKPINLVRDTHDAHGNAEGHGDHGGESLDKAPVRQRSSSFERNQLKDEDMVNSQGEPATATDSSIFGKIIQRPEFEGGCMVVRPGCRKGLIANSDKVHLLFFVSSGIAKFYYDLERELVEDELGERGAVAIQPGRRYDVENMSKTKDLVLYFVRIWADPSSID